MKKNFIFVIITIIISLLILFIVGQFFFENESVDSFVEEKVPEEIVVLPIMNTNIADDEKSCVVLDDFAGGSPKLGWFTVNDGVMGGRSQGFASLEKDVLVHSGVINTNGGGFSYVGARLPENALTGYSRLEIRLNTYGRQYSVNLSDARNSRISHQAKIPLDFVNSWQEVSIDFDKTVPTIFSRRVDSKPLVASEIDEMSFILGDGVDGPFRMEIDWIKTCL